MSSKLPFHTRDTLVPRVADSSDWYADAYPVVATPATRAAAPVPPAPIDDDGDVVLYAHRAAITTPREPPRAAPCAAAAQPPLSLLAAARALNRERIMGRVVVALQFSVKVPVTSRIPVRALADRFSLPGTFASAETPRQRVTALRIVTETMVRRASGKPFQHLVQHLKEVWPRLPPVGQVFAVRVLTAKGLHACTCGAHGFLAHCTDDENREIAAVLTTFATYLFETLDPPKLAVAARSAAHAGAVLRAVDECAAFEGWLREVVARVTGDPLLPVFDDDGNVFDRLAQLRCATSRLFGGEMFAPVARHIEHIRHLRDANVHHPHLMEQDDAERLSDLCRDTKRSIEQWLLKSGV